jgi:hypothetical protein
VYLRTRFEGAGRSERGYKALRIEPMDRHSMNVLDIAVASAGFIKLRVRRGRGRLTTPPGHFHFFSSYSAQRNVQSTGAERRALILSRISSLSFPHHPFIPSPATRRKRYKRGGGGPGASGFLRLQRTPTPFLRTQSSGKKPGVSTDPYFSESLVSGKLP